jgi:hypothetical protein
MRGVTDHGLIKIPDRDLDATLHVRDRAEIP